ncbi:MAG TPA: glycosyl hydrolase [Acidobacteriota bacterium]|nr:glycosyl hydrolase [Acidobacteriota bacterium]
MRRVYFFALLTCFLGWPILAQVEITSATLGDLQPRAIGPAVMSGRIAALAVSPSDTTQIYVGAAGGGVWRSNDGGASFEPIFDEHTQSIGALALDPSNGRVIWVGTGEPWVRNSVGVGDGIYRSSDGGRSFQHMGLEDSERIAQIIVHPADSDTVWVAAMGPLWSAGGQRGVYKTADGGKTWEQVLAGSDTTGAADLIIDRQNPDVLYASLWDFRRTAYSFHSGGPGSGLYKSVDGGQNWTLLDNGLPEGELGRISLALAPSRPNRLYAIVESEESALYRSDDAGASWERADDSSNVIMRPFYFGEILVDPQDYRRVYRPAYTLTISSDAGESFEGAGNVGVHPDHHAYWVNPDDPRHQLTATDGGLYRSLDRGRSWVFLANLPVSQFYQVRYDMQDPYWVYGGLQDNGSWRGPSDARGGVGNHMWQNLGGGDGFHVWPDPSDPQAVYWESQGGNVQRLDIEVGDSQSIRPFATGEDVEELRFNWNTPIHIGASSQALYTGAQYLFRSSDQGRSWQRISPDLTSDDPEKQRQAQSGGLTIDNTTAENHCTIYTISESPLDPAIIWTGSDDGRVHVTRDGGQNWNDVTANIQDLPEAAWVSSVHASPHAAGRVYAAFDNHRSGDRALYLYRSDDFGLTWSSLAQDSVQGFGRVLRDDPVNPDLLFAGTESGLFISLDGGGHWAALQGLPAVSVRDVAIHPRDHDLVMATHGRGIYILDDLTPLRHLNTQAVMAEAALLPSRPVQLSSGFDTRQRFQAGNWNGQGRGEMAVIAYHLRKRHILGDLKVEIFDGDGNLVITLPGGKRKGLNRVQWAMRGEAPQVAQSPTLEAVPALGPLVAEGTYKIRLTKGKNTYEGDLQLILPDEFPFTPQQRRQRRDLISTLYEMQDDLAYLAQAVASLKEEAQARMSEAESSDALTGRLENLVEELDRLQGQLVVSRKVQGISGEEQLREKVVGLYANVNFYNGPPTQSQIDRSQALAQEVAQRREDLESLFEQDLPALNQALESAGFQALTLLSRQAYEESKR